MDVAITVKDIVNELNKHELAILMPDDTNMKKLWLLHSLFGEGGKFYAFRGTERYHQVELVQIDPMDFIKFMPGMNLPKNFNKGGKMKRGTWSLTCANLAYCKDVENFIDNT